MKMRIRICQLFFGLALAAVFLPYGPVRAAPHATIQVFPGTRAIRKALREANPGDVLNIHAGMYSETLEISKNKLTLQAAGDGKVIVDGQCLATSVITINAEGTIIRGLKVRGGAYYSIDLEHHASARFQENTLQGTCIGVEYGINVFDGESIKIIGNKAKGFHDAGIYVGGINATPNGALVVRGNNTFGNTRGIIIEDSVNVVIVARDNQVHDNTTTGIYLHNSDGIRVVHNTVTNNGNAGIYLDANSDSNTVNSNALTRHTFDLLNEGSGNCFNNNDYATSSGPITAC
jgi:parallel beta-helix repeat protein